MLIIGNQYSNVKSVNQSRIANKFQFSNCSVKLDFRHERRTVFVNEMKTRASRIANTIVIQRSLNICPCRVYVHANMKDPVALYPI